MTLALYLLDPDPAPAWAPFAGVRPLSELRAGAHLIRERWETFVGAEATEVLALPHLAGFAEPGMPPVRARHAIAGPAVIGSSTFAPRGIAPALPAAAARLVSRGITVGWAVPAGTTWEGPQPVAQAVEVPGVVLHGVFDLLPALNQLLPEDLQAMLGDSDPIPAGSIVIGDPAGVAVHGAVVEPGVVFDVSNGPVVVESGAEIRSGARLEGPLWIGANTRVLGGDIRGSAIGPRCNVRGEMSACVFLGYANKSHDGFVGSSIVGRWANFGAGSVTSNLKNTYGPVRLDVAGTAIETGQQFLGSLLGDHAKTAIGTLLVTGTVVGAGASVFDGVRAPKYVAPFAWGGGTDERMTRDGFLKTVERVLPRRDETLTPEMREVLGRVYDWATR
ncbi:MAG TPA: putative sugar nucleotidyl transferase [Gemmatimonadales bacterium]|nr:putative sugar nucleotidyl transferase [Gemmatimonadales bacterium]